MFLYRDFLMFMLCQDFSMFILHMDFLMLLIHSNFPMFISSEIPYILFTMENPKEKNWTSGSQIIHTYTHAVAHLACGPPVAAPKRRY